MQNPRKKHDPQFKAKVALEAIRGLKTAAQISAAYGLHTSQIAKWKKLALEGLPGIFDGKPLRQDPGDDTHIAKRYEQIGRLQVELDWLKKKSGPLC